MGGNVTAVFSFQTKATEVLFLDDFFAVYDVGAGRKYLPNRGLAHAFKIKNGFDCFLFAIKGTDGGGVLFLGRVEHVALDMRIPNIFTLAVSVNLNMHFVSTIGFQL